jgi:hypothetical protein
LKSNREFFYFDYEGNDIIQLFRLFTQSDSDYKIEDAKEFIKYDVQFYENRPEYDIDFELKTDKKVFMQATLDRESNEFIFDRDVSNVMEPNFSDKKNGSALKSAKKLYAEFVKNGEIDENGTFLLKGKRIHPSKMSRYTIVILNKSVNWIEKWKAISGTEKGKTYKKIFRN